MSAAIRIASTATAVPPHAIPRQLVKEQIGRIFGLPPRRLEAILAVIDNSEIDCRYVVLPVDSLVEPRPLARISQEYRQHAIDLGRCAVQQALDRAGATAADVDLFITVSCTGIMIPSLDAYLAPRNGLPAWSRRRGPHPPPWARPRDSRQRELSVPQLH
jgi:predicted naringenin-chalcone synthase